MDKGTEDSGQWRVPHRQAAHRPWRALRGVALAGGSGHCREGSLTERRQGGSSEEGSGDTDNLNLGRADGGSRLGGALMLGALAAQGEEGH